jgi:hypothetical protein
MAVVIVESTRPVMGGVDSHLGRSVGRRRALWDAVSLVDTRPEQSIWQAPGGARARRGLPRPGREAKARLREVAPGKREDLGWRDLEDERLIAPVLAGERAPVQHALEPRSATFTL